MTKRVHLYTSITSDQRSHGFGEEVDVPADVADRMIARGQGRLVETNGVETATLEPRENAARRTKR